MVKRNLSLFESPSSWFSKWSLKFALFLQAVCPPGDLGAEYNYIEFIFDMFLVSLSHYSATFISTTENITIFSTEQIQSESEMNDMAHHQAYLEGCNLNSEPVYNIQWTPNFCLSLLRPVAKSLSTLKTQTIYSPLIWQTKKQWRIKILLGYHVFTVHKAATHNDGQ